MLKSRSAAAGEARALLARPLLDRLHEGPGRQADGRPDPAALHTYANGNFKDFVKAMNKNPAMMEFLDTVRNDKDVPNENYARELQELFTLGVQGPAAGAAQLHAGRHRPDRPRLHRLGLRHDGNGVPRHQTDHDFDGGLPGARSEGHLPDHGRLRSRRARLRGHGEGAARDRRRHRHHLRSHRDTDGEEHGRAPDHLPPARVLRARRARTPTPSSTRWLPTSGFDTNFDIARAAARDLRARRLLRSPPAPAPFGAGTPSRSSGRSTTS